MRVFHAPSHNFLMPVVFVNGWEKEHREFLDNYDPREGFYLYKEKDTHLLCSGGIKYKLELFTNSARVPVAFRLKSRDMITQRDTLDIANKAIRITGLDVSCFRNQVQAYSSDYIDFRQTQATLKEFFSAPRKAPASNPDRLWETLSKINDSKQTFASQFLIQWPYLSFRPGSNIDDRYTCVFEIAPPAGVIQKNEARFALFREENDLVEEDAGDNENNNPETLREHYINAYSPGAMMEIPLNRTPDSNGKQKVLIGTVIRLELPGVTHNQDGEPVKLPEDFFSTDAYFQQPWVLELAFMDDNKYSTADIPLTNGILGERVSTDYKNTKKALLAMYNPGSKQCWEAAEDVLIRHKADPISMDIEPVYTSKNLTENQKQAIKMALNTKDFLLVQGPPGTGKTTIITEMVRNFVAQDKRVLICSKGNLAVDNVLEKWVKENKGRSDSHLCVRLGQNFRLDFLKKYTPSQVVVSAQEAVYNKTQAERNRLAEQLNSRIRHVENNRDGVLRLAEQAIAACDLMDALFALLPAYKKALAAKPKSKILQQKVRDGEAALQAVQRELFAPCYRFLCSEEAPTQAQLDRFNQHYAQTAHNILSAMAEYAPGFFERLRTGKYIKAWKPMEQQLRSSSQNYYHNARIRGNALQANPLLTEPTLRAALKIPSDQHLTPKKWKQLLTNFHDCVVTFAQRETNRLNKIRNVLNKWLEELGSGVSASLERDLVVQSIPLIGATCMGVMSDDDYKTATYDVVIVDEAGQIPIFDLIVPLVKAKKVILIGDHIQLPPMDEQDFAKYYAAEKASSNSGPEYEQIKADTEKWYNVSLFQTLFEEDSLQDVRITLDTQYRMHPDISDFVATTFYGGKENYKAGVSAKARTLKIAGFDKPIYFYDTCDLAPEKRFETEHNPGYSNKAEAEKIAQILEDLILAIREGSGDSEKLILRDKETGAFLGYDIGVISGYKKQVNRIHALTMERLMKHMPQEEAQYHMDQFMISSVDSFQGRDNQVIIFSMTRSNNKGRIGFLKDVRRLNVAMTRAKSLLIMVGDSATLRDCNKPCTHNKNMIVSDVYRALVDYCNGGNENGHNYYHKLKGEDLLGTD